MTPLGYFPFWRRPSPSAPSRSAGMYNGCLMRHAPMLLIALLGPCLQSQSPAPTPTARRETKQNEISPKRNQTNPDNKASSQSPAPANEKGPEGTTGRGRIPEAKKAKIPRRVTGSRRKSCQTGCLLFSLSYWSASAFCSGLLCRVMNAPWEL